MNRFFKQSCCQGLLLLRIKLPRLIS
uniref:Uncharacterized protein n=1 Tax=Anguilla anguilla TaxID=7936 RepID=A0A0E9Q5J2_ANGAN